jgi:hypothetical protein
MPVIPQLTVLIQEESPESDTGGSYGTETVEFTAAASAVTTHSITLPISISMLAARMDAKSKNDGDRIGFDVNPNTVVGALAESVAQDAKTIPLPQSVINLFNAGVLFVGMHLILAAEDCGIITSFNATSANVTIGPATSKVAGDLIKITASMSPAILQDGWVKIYNGDNKVYNFGDDKIGGSYLKKGSIIRIRYENSGPSILVSILLSYLY